MRFRSKPKEIEAVEFIPDNKNLPPHVKTRQHDGRWQVYNPLHDSWININPYDYIRIDLKNDIYPIERGYMFNNYEVI